MREHKKRQKAKVIAIRLVVDLENDDMLKLEDCTAAACLTKADLVRRLIRLAHRDLLASRILAQPVASLVEEPANG